MMADRTRQTIRDGSGTSVTALVGRFVFLSFVWKKKPRVDFPRREVWKFLRRDCQIDNGEHRGRVRCVCTNRRLRVEHCLNKSLLVFCIKLIKSKSKRVPSRGTVMFTEETISVRWSDTVMNAKHEDEEVECLKETGLGRTGTNKKKVYKIMRNFEEKNRKFKMHCGDK